MEFAEVLRVQMLPQLASWKSPKPTNYLYGTVQQPSTTEVGKRPLFSTPETSYLGLERDPWTIP